MYTLACPMKRPIWMSAGTAKCFGLVFAKNQFFAILAREHTRYFKHRLNVTRSQDRSLLGCMIISRPPPHISLCLRRLDGVGR